MTSAIFVGLSTIDLIHTVDAFPSSDTKAVARSQELEVGGPATNAAITFSHLGGSATLVAAVGRHTFSAFVKSELQRYAVGLIDLTPESDEPPPISSVWVNQRGERSIVSVNATRFKIPPSRIDPRVLEGASILLVDGHSMETCRAWSEDARTAGIPVVFDGGSWKPGTGQLLKLIDTAICSADFRPPGCTNENEAFEYLRGTGVRQIAITRGAHPIRFAAGPHDGFVEVPEVNALDTTGAGDILHGAFCYYASVGCEFSAALVEASIVAAESCRFRGTRSWMRTQSGSGH